MFELDVQARRFRAFQRIGGEWGTIMHEKPLDAKHALELPAFEEAEEAWAAHEAAAVGRIRVRAEDAPVAPEWVIV